jgi:hypothetical protein
MALPGIPFNVNGRAWMIRGIAFTEGPLHLPTWTVALENDHGSTAGTAGSLGDALLYAARAAATQPKEA